MRGAASGNSEARGFGRWSGPEFFAGRDFERENAAAGFRLGRVRDGHGEFHGIVVSALVAFLQMHLIGMRIAEMVDPGARIETVRFNYQYVAPPMRGRESPPSEKIRIVGKFSAPTRWYAIHNPTRNAGRFCRAVE